MRLSPEINISCQTFVCFMCGAGGLIQLYQLPQPTQMNEPGRAVDEQQTKAVSCCICSYSKWLKTNETHELTAQQHFIRRGAHGTHAVIYGKTENGKTCKYLANEHIWHFCTCPFFAGIALSRVARTLCQLRLLLHRRPSDGNDDDDAHIVLCKLYE